MSKPRQLRPYQKEAVAAVQDYWGQDHAARRTPVVILPTGTGKSTVIAALAVDAVRRGLNVLLLAHRRELLDQMADSVVQVDPDLTGQVGIVQGERDINPGAPVVAASFQTLMSPARWTFGQRQVVLVDEMHHSTAPTYMEVLERLGVLDGTNAQGGLVFAAGFTATASRADGGLGQVWDNVVYERSLIWAIKQGYLTKPRGLTVVLPDMDLSQVTVRAGDYAQGELEAVMSSSVETTVIAMLTHAVGRRSIVFAAGVDHARELAAALTRYGVPAAAVTGDMAAADRETVYNAFRDGSVQSMVTVQVLTEGADFPMCDCAVMARPTRSQTLYSQMVGRAVRLWPGKQDALVLDLAGTARDMSLVTLSSLDPEAPVKRVGPASLEDPGQEEPVKRERRERIGVAELETLDLLQVSAMAWLTTPKGVRFLDCQHGVLVFIWPPNPTESTPCSVGLMHNPPRPTDGWVASDLSLAAAVTRAESTAAREGTPPAKGASWRKRGAPSERQISLAKGLGIADAENKTRARLSDDISTVLAANRLDPFVQE